MQLQSSQESREFEAKFRRQEQENADSETLLIRLEEEQQR